VSEVKKNIGKRLLGASLLLTTLALYPIAQAQNPPSQNTNASAACCSGMIGAVNSMSAAVTTALSAGFTNLADQINSLVQASVDFSNTLATNAAYQTTLKNNWNNTDAITQSDEMTKAALIADSTSSNNQINRFAGMIPRLGNNTTQVDNSVKNVSIGSLIGEKALSSNDKLTAARNYIQYASTASFRRQVLPPGFSNINNPSVLAYQDGLGVITALQSNPQMVLNKALARRTVQQGLGKASNMPIPDASLLQVQEYIATAALSPEWYKTMSTANPADIQKQMVFMMANMQAQMLLQLEQMEQMNITLALIQSQNLNGANQDWLDKLKTTALNSVAR
jgi:hypothetical protein